MIRLTDKRSIVGVDPTSRGLAFVFFESGRVLDWGTCRDDGNDLAVLDRILDGCAADVLVLEDPDAAGCQRNRRIQVLLRELSQRGRRDGRIVVQVARQEVRQAWATGGVRAKHYVAATLAEWFPELESILPPPRKSYRSEDARVQIFDAASLVIHAFGVGVLSSP